jgi:hypothetical protein
MSWLPAQLGLLTLAAAAAWPLPAEGGAAQAPPREVRVEQRADVPAPPDGTEQPGLRKAGPPLACALSAERPGQPRVELRQPGLKAWLLASVDAGTRWSPAATPRPEVARWDRLRLHVLLCTWLN